MTTRIYEVVETLKLPGIIHRALWLSERGVLLENTPEDGIRLTRNWDPCSAGGSVRMVRGNSRHDNEIIAHAKLLQVKKQYDIIHYNCEHFLSELLSDELHSPQLGLIGLLAMGAIIVYAINK